MAAATSTGGNMQGMRWQVQPDTAFTAPTAPVPAPVPATATVTPSTVEQLLSSIPNNYACLEYTAAAAAEPSNNDKEDSIDDDDMSDDYDSDDDDEYEYLFPFYETPPAAFKACRRAYILVTRAIRRNGLARKNPEWLKTWEESINDAKCNDYYPELSFGTQTICWLGMQLAGGSLDILKDHIEGWRVKPFGRYMLADILAANAANTRRRPVRAVRVRRARRIAARRAGL